MRLLGCDFDFWFCGASIRQAVNEFAKTIAVTSCGLRWLQIRVKCKQTPDRAVKILDLRSKDTDEPNTQLQRSPRREAHEP